MVDWCGPFFGYWNLLIIIWSIVLIYMYFICIQNKFLQEKSLIGFKIWKSLNPREQKSKSQYSHDFLFFEYKLDKMQGKNWGLILRGRVDKRKRKRWNEQTKLSPPTSHHPHPVNPNPQPPPLKPSNPSCPIIRRK